MSSRLAAVVAERRYPQQQYHQIPGAAENPQATYHAAYGRDGAPSDRVIRPVQPTFQHPAPKGLHVDTTRGLDAPQGLYSPGGTYRSRGGSPSPPPSYSDGGHSPPHQRLAAPPTAAFVQPKSPILPNSGMGGGGAFTAVKGVQEHSGAVSWGEGVQEKAAREFRSDEEPPMFWKRMSGVAKNRQSSTWLKQQSGKSTRFRNVTWAITILVLCAIVGLIVVLLLRKKDSSSSTTPEALTWANGVASTEVPSIFASQAVTSASAASARAKRHFGASPTAGVGGYGHY